MRLLVLTPESVLLDRKGLQRIRLPLADGGEIGIRPGHHPLLAETASGRVAYGEGSYDQSIALQAGILEIDRSGAVIYTSGPEDGAGEGAPHPAPEPVYRVLETATAREERRREGR